MEIQEASGAYDTLKNLENLFIKFLILAQYFHREYCFNKCLI